MRAEELAKIADDANKLARDLWWESSMDDRYRLLLAMESRAKEGACRFCLPYKENPYGIATSNMGWFANWLESLGYKVEVDTYSRTISIWWKK